ncbi:MAG: hypothetical protein ABIK26_08320 [Candidatus Omnitrophota bacterium]
MIALSGAASGMRRRCPISNSSGFLKLFARIISLAFISYILAMRHTVSPGATV